MKIAMVINTLDRGFAIPNCVENLARCYNQLGHNAKIFTFKKTETFYDVPCEECRFAGLRIPVSFLEHPVFRWIAMASLYLRLKNYRPHIVNVDYTPVDTIVLFLRKFLSFRVSYTYYGAPPADLYEGDLKNEKIQRKNKMLKQIKQSDQVISISHFLHKELFNEGIPSATIPVGIDTNHFTPDKKLPNVEKKNPVLLHVGRIVPHKGFEDLIHIFKLIRKEIPLIKLYLIGKHTIPSHADKIKALCNGLQENIFFTGFIPDTLLPYFHNLADVFICTSQWEGSGTVLLEAQSCGVPVVAYRLHSFPESVHDGESGILVPQGDPEAFAQAVLKLIREQPKHPQAKTAGRNFAQAFDWKYTAEKTLTCYAKLLKDKKT